LVNFTRGCSKSSPTLSCRASFSCLAERELGIPRFARNGVLHFVRDGAFGCLSKALKRQGTPRLAPWGDKKEGSVRQPPPCHPSARFPFCLPEARKCRGTPRFARGDIKGGVSGSHMGLAQILKQPHSTLVKNPKAFTFKSFKS